MDSQVFSELFDSYKLLDSVVRSTFQAIVENEFLPLSERWQIYTTYGSELYEYSMYFSDIKKLFMSNGLSEYEFTKSIERFPIGTKIEFYKMADFWVGKNAFVVTKIKRVAMQSGFVGFIYTGDI